MPTLATRKNTSPVPSKSRRSRHIKLVDRGDADVFQDIDEHSRRSRRR